MVKYPRYIFRTEIVLQLIKRYIPKNTRFLEIGCADGDLSLRLAKLGLSGDTFDISDEGVEIAKESIKKSGFKDRINISKNDLFTFETAHPYDLVVMLEVLEHIKDDRAALVKTNSLLKKNGRLLISVPGKKNLWGPDDELVGHYRRYEKKEFSQRLNESGFTVLKFYSYGFPFLNIMKIVRGLAAKGKITNNEKDKTKLSKKSGLNPLKSNLFEKFPIFNRYSLLPLMFLSNRFNKYDLGEGYLCIAKKRNT